MDGDLSEGSYPSGVPLTGTLPLPVDFTACIVFSVAYTLLLPLVVYRVASRSSRCFALIRPAIFVPSRIGAFAVRAVMSKGNNSKNLLISEQVIMQCGFILLVDPLLRFAAYHIERNVQPKLGRKRRWIRWSITGLQVLLVVALALIIFSSTQYGDLDQPNTFNAVQKSRETSVLLQVIVCWFCGVVVLVAHLRESLPFRQGAVLGLMSLCLTIASVYKTVTYFAPASETHVVPKIAFYVLTSTPELLVSILIFFPNVVTFYAIDEARARNREQKLLDGEMKDHKETFVSGFRRQYPLPQFREISETRSNENYGMDELKEKETA